MEDIFRRIVSVVISIAFVGFLWWCVIPVLKQNAAHLTEDEDKQAQAQEEIHERNMVLDAPVIAITALVENIETNKQAKLQEAIENNYTVYVDGQKTNIENIAINHYDYVISDNDKAIYCESKWPVSPWMIGLAIGSVFSIAIQLAIRRE